MKEDKQLQVFNQEVASKYKIYNSLFMHLPYEKMENIGTLLPFLNAAAKEGFKKGETPKKIIENFFSQYTHLNKEEQIDLLFRFIQYIERQVVLFDAVEDAAFESLNSFSTSGTLSNIYQLAKDKAKLSEVREKLQDFSVRLVFTAHPTQFYPNSVLHLMQDLRHAIAQNDIKAIDKLLQQLGKTPFYKKIKPTPFDEAVSIIYYLRNVYYHCIGTLLNDVQSIFFPDGGFTNYNLFQLGFWPGGDRDGNPYITYDITKKVSDELRFSILKCYYTDLKNLSRSLTFYGIEEPINSLLERIYNNMFGLEKTLTYPELMDSLEKIKNTLITEHNALFLEDLESFIVKVRAFGLHFASLDIRQDSKVHTQVVETILKQNKIIKQDYHDLTDEQKLRILDETILKINPEDYKDELVRDTLYNIKQIKTIQKTNGLQAIHRYIISNCETMVDVMQVYTLFRWCSYKPQDIKIDIVPLFETITGLTRAQDIMDELYRYSPYQKHIVNRENTQTIMLGFSDGTKDGGYLKANWEIFQAKESLSAVSKENGIKVIFFDGRGGPPARGGGKTHRFYASQGESIANNEIQLTIQGQTITSQYGTEEQTYSNIEQLLSAGVLNTIVDKPENNLSPVRRLLLTSLAEDAYKKYEDLKKHEKFVPYLERMSTLPYYGMTNIGSRPTKRSTTKELRLEDLRAIPFVGSWSQLKQNVPGYYGLGTALYKKEKEGKLEMLKTMYKESAFFKTLILNSMMSMSKTYFPLTFYIKDNKEFGTFWQNLYEEFQLSVEMVLKISESTMLMQEELLSKESIQIREEIVLPLLCIQQYALQNIQENTGEKATFEKMVTRSLFGNINASRNSA